MRLFLFLILINTALTSYTKSVSKEEKNNNILNETESLIHSHNFHQALLILKNYNFDSINDLQYFNLKGLAYYYLKEYEIAIKTNDSVLNRFNEISPPKDTILSKIYNNQGLNYLMLGDYKQSIYYLEKAKDIKKMCYLDNDKAHVNIYVNLSILYKRIGEIEKALELYSLIENIYSTQNDLKSAYIYFNKANLLRSINKLEEAILSYNKSLNIFLELNEFEYISNVYNNLGNVYLQLKEYEKAKEYYQKCISFRDRENVQHNPKVYNNLGLVLYDIEDYKKSLENLNRAKKLYLELFGSNHTGLINVYTNSVRVYLEIGQINSAKRDIEKAYNLATKNLGQNHKLTSSVLSLKAEINFKQNDYNLALDYMNRALNSIDQNEIRPYSNEFHIITLLSRKAEMLEAIGERKGKPEYYTEAMKTYEKAVELIVRLNTSFIHNENQLRFIKQKHEIIIKALDLAYEMHSNSNNDNYLEKAFQFSELAKYLVLNTSLNEQKALLLGEVPDSLNAQEKKLNMQILYNENKLYADDGKIETKIANILIELYQQKDSLVRFFEKNYPRYYELKYAVSYVNINEIQNKLNNNEAIIEYTVAPNKLYSLLISKKDIKFLKQNIDSSFISDVKFLNDYISYNSWVASNKSNFERFKDVSHKIYTTLVKPFEKDISNKNLTIIPDDILNYIPFEVLLTNQDQEINDFGDLSYLIKRNPLHYQYSANIRYNYNQESNQNNQLLAFTPYDPVNSFGNSNINRSGLQILKGAEEEIKSIHNLIKGKTFRGAEANEKNFKENISKYGLVHIATHGLINTKDPLSTQLILSSQEEEQEDGILNLYELYSLKFHPQLLVLSACNTGFGKYAKGEGILSFARSFVDAGCSSIIMTLWPISDETSPGLMKTFYKNLVNGDNKAVALQKAKIKYLQQADPLMKHPFFWAGYVNLGNSESIDIQKNNSSFLYVIPLILIVILIVIFRYRKFR